jgi:hypothetical protein
MIGEIGKELKEFEVLQGSYQGTYLISDNLSNYSWDWEGQSAMLVALNLLTMLLQAWLMIW